METGRLLRAPELPKATRLLVHEYSLSSRAGTRKESGRHRKAPLSLSMPTRSSLSPALWVHETTTLIGIIMVEAWVWVA